MLFFVFEISFNFLIFFCFFLSYALLLPKDPLPEDAVVGRLLGCDSAKRRDATWKEVCFK